MNEVGIALGSQQWESLASGYQRKESHGISLDSKGKVTVV